MKQFLCLLAFGFATAFIARGAPPPNIIFVLSDDLAAVQPDLVAKATALLKQARTDDPNWPLRAVAKKKK